MFRHFPQHDRSSPDPGRRVRRSHACWLTRALDNRDGHWPLIPLRRVVDRGFRALTATPNGGAWAEMWWESALARIELEL